MSSQKVVCGFCHKGGEESSTSGRLYSHESIHAHLRCMQYSSGLAQYQKGRYPQLGGFKWSQVKDEMKRGSHLKCHVCGKKKGGVRGATAGCTIRKCSKTFHFTCAALDKTSITKRIVVHSPGEDEKVFYRVFCGKAHFQIYEAHELKKLGAFEYQSDSEEEEDDDEDEDSGTSDPQSSSKDTVSEDRLSTTTESSSERKHGYCDDSILSEISGSSPKKPKTDSQSGSGNEEENSLDSSKENASSVSRAVKSESPSFKGACDSSFDSPGVGGIDGSDILRKTEDINTENISDNTCASDLSVKNDCATNKTDDILSKHCSRDAAGFVKERSSDVDRADDGSGVVTDGATNDACHPNVSDTPSVSSDVQQAKPD